MTEKQRDMKYLHKYKSVDDFNADYNGEYYHEPWVSISPSLTVTGLTMEDNFCYTYGATWEYECERDAVDLECGRPGPMGTQHVYEWTYVDTSMGTPVTLNAATLVRNPSVGTQIYESGVNDGNWHFVSTNPARVLTVSGTPSESLDKVDYNKRQSDEKYIRIETTIDEYGGYEYSVVETNLTCEDLEETGNTYVVYMTVYEYEAPDPTEVESTLVYSRYEEGDSGPVWNVEYDVCCMVGCNGGEIGAWHEG